METAAFSVNEGETLSFGAVACLAGTRDSIDILATVKLCIGCGWAIVLMLRKLNFSFASVYSLILLNLRRFQQL